jgi:hypothetical protein
MTSWLSMAPGVEWIAIDQAVLVYDGDLVNLLEGSAAEVWRALEHSTSDDDVAALLAGRHPEAAGVAGEVTAFLSDLLERGLIVSAAEPGGSGIVCPEHVAWTLDDDGRVVVADLGTGRRETLSASASRVWVLTLADMTSTDLVRQLLLEFPDAPKAVAEEVELLRSELVARGLLARTAGSV